MSNNKQHIPAGYKPSPLGIIPEDWEVKRLGEVCDIDKESLSNKTDPNYEFDYISLSDVDSDCFETTTSKQTFRTAPSRARRIVKQGDVIISTVRPNLQAFTLIKDKVNDLIVSTGFAVLTPKQIISEYLFQYVFSHNVSKQFYQLVVGSNYPAVNSSDVSHLKIAVPSINEQQRIVDVLELWDTAIEKQTALIEKLTLRKRGLMQKLLTAKKRLKGFGGEWKEVRLGEVGVFFKGGGVPKDKITDTGNKCLTYGDLYTKYDFVISGVKSYIDDNTANESVKILYGDICFAGSGETKEDIGKCAAFIDNEFGYAGGDIIVFRATDYNPITLSYILNSNDVIRQKSNMGQGHSVVHIYPYQLEKLMIKLPSRAEQDAIATILIESDKEIEIQKQKLAAMQEQKKGLMQVLLTGKKRII